MTSDANDFTGEKQPENKVPEAATPSIVWEKRPVTRKPRIILAASGSVAAIKFGILADSLSDWAEVRAVATKPSLHFIDRKSLPASVKLYTDDDEWSSWSRIGDNVLHIELRKWADAMLIAPLSANTLAKVRNLGHLDFISHFCSFQFTPPGLWYLMHSRVVTSLHMPPHSHSEKSSKPT